jgi:hypothetical protein
LSKDETFLLDTTRNIVAHAHGKVDLDKIWVAITLGLPDLVRDLEPFVPSDDGIEPPTKLPPPPEAT